MSRGYKNIMLIIGRGPPCGKASKKGKHIADGSFHGINWGVALYMKPYEEKLFSNWVSRISSINSIIQQMNTSEKS